MNALALRQGRNGLLQEEHGSATAAIQQKAAELQAKTEKVVCACACACACACV
jgi:hypothetical protein